MRDEPAQLEAAAVIAKTERVTLALHEFPPSSQPFDDVFAHAWAVVDSSPAADPVGSGRVG